MKIILPIAISTIISSCALNSKKVETNNCRKSAIEITTSYPSITNKTNLIYNNKNRIEKIIRSSNGFENSYLICNYNDLGLPIKLDTYFNNSLSHFKTIKWFNDSLYITKFKHTEKEFVEHYREAYYYNENRQLTQIIRYKKDSLDNWQKRGSKYEFEWKDGNLAQIKCYVQADYLTNDSVIVSNANDEESLFELDELSDEIIKDGYTLYYVSTYTYDNKNNPYINTSISQLILPNESNISTNNPVTIEKKYTEGEIIKFDLSYIYNESDYPTMTNIKLSSNIENFDEVEYSREFEY